LKGASPSIRYKSHHFTKYTVIGKEKRRKIVRRRRRLWNKVRRRRRGERGDKEALLVYGSELTYLKY
jgi:hypothetical protein